MDNLREDDLTPDLKILLGVCGMDTVKQILYSLQSTQLYIPKVATLTDFVTRCATENAEKKSVREMAVDIGVSRRYLENVLRAKRKGEYKLIKKKSKRKKSVSLKEDK